MQPDAVGFFPEAAGEQETGFGTEEVGKIDFGTVRNIWTFSERGEKRIFLTQRSSVVPFSA